MQRFGSKPGQTYNASQVKAARVEIPGGEFDFLLKGEMDLAEEMHLIGEPSDPVQAITSDWRRERDEQLAKLEAAAARRPAKYPAAEFTSRCAREASAGLEKHLGELCLDPGRMIADGDPWYFPTLVSTLREFQAEWIATRRPAATTSIGNQVCEALDYSLQSGRLALIDGQARIGKTFSAKAWCDLHPGRARYVQVPATNDDFSFFRDIARSLGVSIYLKSKAQELRIRIEETLQAGQLMLVLDEAHYLFPGSHYRNTTPGRVNWLMTALVNYGVPVALITTPQFFRCQKAIEAATCWTSEQFTGRIGHYEKLPDSLTPGDLRDVATALVPNGEARSIAALVLYAQSSAKYLAGIEAVTGRAQFIARKDGREKVEFRDIKRAIQERVIPSDSAFAAAIQKVEKPSRKSGARPLAPSPQDVPGARDVRPLQSERPRFDTEQREAVTAET